MNKNKPAIAVFNAIQTAELLDFPNLVAVLATTVHDYANGAVTAPERQAIPFAQGALMLSMPATARDIGIHKLVNVAPGNRSSGLPTIHGFVSAFDGKTGQTLFILDGPTVTARRTAAVTLLGLKTFLKSPPKRIALIGAGAQAMGHAQAIAAVFPNIGVVVVGSNREKADAFIHTLRHLPLRFEADASVPDNVDAVITLTTSKAPVYSLPARTDRLLIGVGAFQADSAEIAAETILASQVYVDDLAGARHEAGDIILARADWAAVGSLSQALSDGVDFSRPIVFKTVGCAAWDLAAARCALANIQQGG